MSPHGYQYIHHPQGSTASDIIRGLIQLKWGCYTGVKGSFTVTKTQVLHYTSNKELFTLVETNYPKLCVSELLI